MTQPPTSIPPVRRTVVVNAPPAAAFRRFTAEIASWWPLKTHSLGEGATETCVFEGRVGGRIVERIRGGREAVWGTVTAWEPPHRVAFTWHPGQNPDTAQDVEVRFVSDGNRTGVELTHTGWERLGAQGKKFRNGYNIGWVYVLGIYARRRGPVMALLHGLTAVVHRANRLKRPRPSSPEAGVPHTS